MPLPRPAVDPAWPPLPGAYDYVLTLNAVELAWEFLRRNPDYRAAFATSPPVVDMPEQVATGKRIWSARQDLPLAASWGLHTFRRSGSVGARCTGMLVARYRSGNAYSLVVICRSCCGRRCGTRSANQRPAYRRRE